jgi:hypothetical protein
MSKIDELLKQLSCVQNIKVDAGLVMEEIWPGTLTPKILAEREALKKLDEEFMNYHCSEGCGISTAAECPDWKECYKTASKDTIDMIQLAIDRLAKGWTWKNRWRNESSRGEQMKFTESHLDSILIGIAGILLLSILSFKVVVAIILLSMALKPSRN